MPFVNVKRMLGVAGAVLVMGYAVSKAGATQKGAAAQASDVDQARNALAAADFVVQDGRFEATDLSQCCSPAHVCGGNNPSTPYLQYYLPPAPGQTTPNPVMENTPPDVPSGMSSAWRLRSDEALVFSNVVDNAVAYEDAHGHVAIVLTASETRDSFRLEVSDDGPGVPPQELPRLGERTFRSDEARQRDPRGSGLGLAITAEVCARCGWTLAFAPLAPRGLVVTIQGAMAARDGQDLRGRGAAP